MREGTSENTLDFGPSVLIKYNPLWSAYLDSAESMSKLEILPSREGRLFDRLAAAEVAASLSIQSILSPSRLERLISQRLSVNSEQLPSLMDVLQEFVNVGIIRSMSECTVIPMSINIAENSSNTNICAEARVSMIVLVDHLIRLRKEAFGSLSPAVSAEISYVLISLQSYFSSLIEMYNNNLQEEVFDSTFVFKNLNSTSSKWVAHFTKLNLAITTNMPLMTSLLNIPQGAPI